MPKTKLDVGANVTYLAKKPDALEFYIEWAALPENKRPKELSSQAKLAKHLDVTEQTLRNWKRDPRVADKIRAIGISGVHVERYASLLEKTYQQAMDTTNPRSIQATKLLLEEMNRHIVSDVVSKDLSNKSNAELKDMAARLYDEFDERTETA